MSDDCNCEIFVIGNKQSSGMIVIFCTSILKQNTKRYYGGTIIGNNEMVVGDFF
jgi:hypothetical protein